MEQKCPKCNEPLPDKLVLSLAGRINSKRVKNRYRPTPEKAREMGSWDRKKKKSE